MAWYGKQCESALCVIGINVLLGETMIYGVVDEKIQAGGSVIFAEGFAGVVMAKQGVYSVTLQLFVLSFY